jgi:hypothetical protein
MNIHADAKQFKCPSCGGGLSLVNKRTNYLTCHYCGSVLDAKSEAHEVLTKIDKPSKHKPMSLVKIGMYGKFQGLNYRVIGRTRWQMDYQEWDAEGSTFEHSTWEYDDWLLISELGTYFYLVEDQEGFARSNTFWPKNPNLPEGERLDDFSTGTRLRAKEYGTATVEFFEGESTYQVKPGDQISFANYDSGNDTYVVEYRTFEGSRELQEVKFWRDIKLPHAQVVSAFAAQNPEVAAIKNRAQVQQQKTAWATRLWTAFTVACFIMCFVSCSNTEIFNQSFPVDMAALQNQSAAVSADASPSDAVEEANVRFIGQTAPFDLAKANEMVSFVVEYNVAGSFDAWAGAEIVDQAGDVVNAFEGDLYRDDESSTSTYVTYKIDKPGKYTMKLYTEKGAIFYGNQPTIIAKVEREHLLTRWFVVALCLGVVGMFVVPMFGGKK